MTFIPVYVVNLKRSAARRDQISEQLNNLKIPFEFFDAVDGRDLLPWEIEALCPTSLRRWLPMGPGEIACATTHLHVLNLIAERGHEFAAVLEDDAIVLDAAKPFLRAPLLQSLPSFDILKLESRKQHSRRRLSTAELSTIGAHSLRARLVSRIETTAQVYALSGAKRIVSEIRTVSAPIDIMIHHDAFYYLPGIRVIEVSPSVAFARPGAASETLGRRSERAPTTLRKFRTAVERFRRLASFVRAWGPITALKLLRRPKLAGEA